MHKIFKALTLLIFLFNVNVFGQNLTDNIWDKNINEFLKSEKPIFFESEYSNINERILIGCDSTRYEKYCVYLYFKNETLYRKDYVHIMDYNSIKECLNVYNAFVNVNRIIMDNDGLRIKNKLSSLNHENLVDVDLKYLNHFKILDVLESHQIENEDYILDIKIEKTEENLVIVIEQLLN